AARSQALAADGDVRDALSAFYAERGQAPVWIDESGRPRRDAYELLSVLEGAAREGLNPEDYEVRALRERMDQAQRTGDGDETLERSLTAMMLSLAKHLYGGRVSPRRVGWQSDPPELDLKRVAHEVAAGGGPTQVLGQLAPNEPHYLRLRERLQALQALGEREYPDVPSGSVLRPGDRDERVRLVRERLRAEGYEARPPPEGPELFDEGLSEAVRAFQHDHGLEVDGSIGVATVRGMRHSLEDHLRRIRWNMERLRWLPRDRGERHVFVNAAGLNAEVREGAETIWQRPVVVGQIGWNTPMFSDRIEGVELFPDWVVPRTIAREEVAPSLQEDAAWAGRNQFVVIDRSTGRPVEPGEVDWGSASADDYLFIQRPGTHNPLGEAKLLMPNRLQIYLHGTKDPAVFEARQRLLSHGCIRVQDVLELTRWLFEGEGRGAEFDAAVAAGERVSLELERPVHVDIVYLTTWVDDEGRLQTRPDVYGRDRALCRALGDCA
ncbi:MAG: L,D-transpeptidase family protein, partial [Myxococcaceae bacterium]